MNREKSNLWGGVMVAVILTTALVAFLSISSQEQVDKVPKSLRKGMEWNDKVTQGVGSNNLVPEYEMSKADKNIRVNGGFGMDPKGFDADKWVLNWVIDGEEGQAPDTLHITLADIKKLPKRDIVFDFKCIEGWNQVTHWGGVKMSDFLAAYKMEHLAKSKQYLGLSTPDSGYFVGIDMASAMHPQTILAYEMNGGPLSMDQGYPLRLIIPVKYGIKHLKRIGSMRFTAERPRDYWYEKGYDYSSGH